MGVGNWLGRLDPLESMENRFMKVLLRSVARWWKKDGAVTRGRTIGRARLAVELLEDRRLPATGFLQGLAFVDANGNHKYDFGTDAPKVGATIQLYSVVNNTPTLQTSTTTGP